jgi:hypothetical protein
VAIALAGLIALTAACATISIQPLPGQSDVEARRAHDICFGLTQSSWRQTLVPLYIESDEQYRDYAACMLERGYWAIYRDEGMGYRPEFLIYPATGPMPPPPPP